MLHLITAFQRYMTQGCLKFFLKSRFFRRNRVAARRYAGKNFFHGNVGNQNLGKVRKFGYHIIVR